MSGASAASADPKEAQAQWPSTPQAEAERMVEKAQTRNMTVKFMLDKLKEVSIHSSELSCRRMLHPLLLSLHSAAGSAHHSTYTSVSAVTPTDLFHHCRRGAGWARTSSGWSTVMRSWAAASVRLTGWVAL